MTTKHKVVRIGLGCVALALFTYIFVTIAGARADDRNAIYSVFGTTFVRFGIIFGSIAILRRFLVRANKQEKPTQSTVEERGGNALTPHEDRLDDRKEPGIVRQEIVTGVPPESARQPRLRESNAATDPSVKKFGELARQLGAVAAICLAVVTVGGLVVSAARGLANLKAAPKTYADCVLAQMKPGMTKEAVTFACQACREKFPRQAVDTTPDDHDQRLFTAVWRHSGVEYDLGQARGFYGVLFGQDEIAKRFGGGRVSPAVLANARRGYDEAETKQKTAFDEMVRTVATLWLQRHPSATEDEAHEYVWKLLVGSVDPNDTTVVRTPEATEKARQGIFSIRLSEDTP